jgi:hypothetical protein
MHRFWAPHTVPWHRPPAQHGWPEAPQAEQVPVPSQAAP